MRSSTLEVRTPDGVADAYLTRPDGAERHPGVLFVMDAYGLRPRIEEMADRIAGRGYAVLAPNVFYRAGHAPVLPFPDMTPGGRPRRVLQGRASADGQLTPERLAADGAAYLDELAKVADEPFAITGYCMGARLGWRIAAAHPDTGCGTRRLSRRRPGQRRRAEPAPLGRRAARRGLLRSRRPGPEQQRRADRHPRGGARRRRSQIPLRGLRRGRPRLHDGRHAGV